MCKVHALQWPLRGGAQLPWVSAHNNAPLSTAVDLANIRAHPASVQCPAPGMMERQTVQHEKWMEGEYYPLFDWQMFEFGQPICQFKKKFRQISFNIAAFLMLCHWCRQEICKFWAQHWIKTAYLRYVHAACTWNHQIWTARYRFQIIFHFVHQMSKMLTDFSLLLTHIKKMIHWVWLRLPLLNTGF